jgi:predicted dehydrogenase
MVEVSEDADVPLMIAYRMQTEPGVRRAKELLANGAVGEPLHVHGHMSDDLLAFIDDPNQWRLTPELSGGATVNDIGIYPLNTTRFLFDADPIAVYGATRWDHEAFADQDEHATFQVEFPNITAACTVSHNASESSHLRVIGTEGELDISPLFFPWSDVELELHRGESRATVDVPQRDQMREEFDYFADCLLSGRDPHADGRHGVVDIETIEAIFQSAETGQRVEL